MTTIRTAVVATITVCALAVAVVGASAAAKSKNHGKSMIVYGPADSNVRGTGTADSLIGAWGQSNDVSVNGRAGDDVFYAGEQMSETFTGGDGADRFVFRAETSDEFQTDTISDFDAEEGDLIDLRFIDANTKVPGIQSFEFIGTDEFHGDNGTYAAAGQLRIADGVLEGDTNGAFDEPELIINLTGVSSLDASALLLSGSVGLPGKSELKKVAAAQNRAKAKLLKQCKSRFGDKGKKCRSLYRAK